MPSVQQYYGSSFYSDQQTILDWLISRQLAKNFNWNANALPTGFPPTTTPGEPYTATDPYLAECGILDLVIGSPLGNFNLSLIENLSLDAIAGQIMDNQGGPDEFPINYSPTPLTTGNLLLPCYPVTAAQIAGAYAANVARYDPHGDGVQMCTPTGQHTIHPLGGMDVHGYVWNLKQSITAYRVEVFTMSGGLIVYENPAPGTGVYSGGGSCQGVQPQPSCFQELLIAQGENGFWSTQANHAGVVIAALYPASAPSHAGYTGTSLPSGWICHSNMGIGQKLTDYFARIYVGNTLLEDNIPIIVQDAYHARCGSSVIPGAGTLELRIIYNDPVAGPTEVFNTAAGESALRYLPLSNIVPTSDPLYVPDPSSMSTPAPQNRSTIYDCALAIMAFAASGNYGTCAEIISELDGILDSTTITPSNPTDSLAASYDTYHGTADQEYVRTGPMAWLCYAYCLYMQLSLDYTPTPYLLRMLNYLLTLKSTASDLTAGMFYEGFGRYVSGTYTPGVIATCLTEDQIILYYAFTRAAGMLPVAATNLVKTSAITAAQAAAMNTLATSLGSVISTLAAQVPAVLYVPAAGGTPGHCAKGVTGSTLDGSLDLEAQAWAAIFFDAIGNDNAALNCVNFLQETFYLTNQIIAKSAASGSYNEIYQQSTPFNGYKPSADSSGGYSGSPASVWQEGSWSVILALLDLYGVAGLTAALGGDAPDDLLSTLIASQRIIWMTPLSDDTTPADDGATLAASLAARADPWDLFVWPSFAASAWYWLVSNVPGMVLTASNSIDLYPCMKIPDGPSQSVKEVDGASSIGSVSMECIDPSGQLKLLAARDTLIGQPVIFQMGFPSLALGDFVTQYVGQVTSVDYTSEGKLVLHIEDVQRYVMGKQLFTLGGPGVWAPGEDSVQPIGEAIAANAFQVSDKNPRWVQGNPIRIALAVLQNELGVGQDPALMASQYFMDQLEDIYSEEQYVDPQPPPSGWKLYSVNTSTRRFDDSTLINPNSYIDVDQWLDLADTVFSGDWMEFKITRPAEGKGWVEDQIFKPLCIYTIVGADGKLRLKTMRPTAYKAISYYFSQANLCGIPQTARRDIINVLKVKTDVDPEGDSRSGLTTAARAYQQQRAFLQQTSLLMFKHEYTHDIESTGLRVNYGAMARAFLAQDRIFRRHAFAPPEYTIEAFLASDAVELGDDVSLSHPKALDYQSGSLGLVNVPCEVIDRQPAFSRGRMRFCLLDKRFLNEGTPYQIAPSTPAVFPAIIQADHISDFNTTLTLSKQLLNPVKKGNAILVFTVFTGGPTSFPWAESVSDSLGSAFEQLQVPTTYFEGIGLWIGFAPADGMDTIEVSYPGTTRATAWGFMACEAVNLNSDPMDGLPIKGNGTGLVTISKTTTQAYDLLLAVGLQDEALNNPVVIASPDFIPVDTMNPIGNASWGASLAIGQKVAVDASEYSVEINLPDGGGFTNPLSYLFALKGYYTPPSLPPWDEATEAQKAQYMYIGHGTIF